MPKRWRLTGTALSARVPQWTQRSLIKSIQRQTISITGASSNTATLSPAVDPNNTLITFLGEDYSNASTNPAIGMARVELTNSTTVTALVNTTPGAQIVIVSFEVVEYWPGVLRSVQRDTVTGSAAKTITSVVTTKSSLTSLGWTTTDTTQDIDINAKLVLTNATTVTQSGGVIANVTSGFQVAEWY